MKPKERVKMDKKVSLKAEETKRDFPLIRNRIIEASLSNDWEEARKEWSFINIYHDDHEQFSESCQLCNASNLKDNYEIINHNTGRKYLVGSKCITRFLILNGAENIEDSSVLFALKTEEILAYKNIHKLLPFVLDIPTPQQLISFRKCCMTVLGRKNTAFDIEPAVWKDFIGKLCIDSTKARGVIIDRIRNALFEPKLIPTRKVKMSTEQEQIKIGSWASRRKSKKTRVTTTLAKSEAYRTDKID